MVTAAHVIELNTSKAPAKRALAKSLYVYHPNSNQLKRVMKKWKIKSKVAIKRYQLRLGNKTKWQKLRENIEGVRMKMAA